MMPYNFRENLVILFGFFFFWGGGEPENHEKFMLSKYFIFFNQSRYVVEPEISWLSREIESDFAVE